MRFLIAPDKFKGSLGARPVAENIALGIRDVLPDAQIEIAPVADGGEGTAEILSHALGGEWVSCAAHDALGRALKARYVWVEGTQNAVIEMSEAAGLQQLTVEERDPTLTTTQGVGEMIAAAVSRGAGHVTVGLGGSATNDGGLGVARALGFRFVSNDFELEPKIGELLKLTRIIRPEVTALPKIVAAADVRNPLLGELGATRVFAPQKGARLEQIELLERALQRLADIALRDLGCDFRDQPGAGAAGGLGFGLMCFCGAELLAGFDVVADVVGLKEKIMRADVVITGEGRLDAQTLEGKAPAGVAAMARQLGKPVYAIVGETEEKGNAGELFDAVFGLTGPTVSRELAMGQSAKLLRERAAEVARTLR